jgi:putative ATP-dependent endonuclease of the OLD family
MQVSKLKIENFRGTKLADLDFDGHTLFVGRNNVGKSTVCEALELALGPDRQSRFPVVEEYDFYNATYLDDGEAPVPIRIEVLLTDVTASVANACGNYLERWDRTKRRILDKGEIENVDKSGHVWCLRLLTIARYNSEEDEFEVSTHYARTYDPENENESRVPKSVRRMFGFLYLRALRTGSRALSLERGSLLDIILRIQSLQTGIWEHVRRRLETLTPPIDEGATTLMPVLKAIEKRIAEYISMDQPGNATRLFVSQLTREHLRKTLSFFLSITADQKPVPFQHVGAGTLNTLVLALLSFIAELKKDNVIFAMEEPEIALPPHTQRRIANYLISNTTQCFVTSHSPYVIERFEPQQVMVLRRDTNANLSGKTLVITDVIKAKTYRRFVRRGLAEAMLGRGVIVVEGTTEQLGLTTVADKMERGNDDLYPLDLAGVTIFCADGDGSVPEFGKFFASLDLSTFAFLDKRTRSTVEQDNLNGAGFTKIRETNYEGMEALLATEVPLNHQWTYLERIRDAALAPKTKIPSTKPAENALRDLTQQLLKDHKGWGRAAELIELCAPSELPKTITEFLGEIYLQFPKPASPKASGEESTQIAGATA